MGYAMIAVLVNNGNVVGYRIFEEATRKTLDIDNNTVYGLLSNGAIIDNIEIANGSIVGSNGALSRYSMIDANTKKMIDEKSKLVVLNRVEVGGIQAGYTVVDGLGNCKRVKTEDAVKYSAEYGIANGKVVTQNGMPYISSINGNYAVETIKANKKYVGNTVFGNSIINTGGMGISRKEAEIEVDSSDAFKALSPGQRKAIIAYYMWYTTTTYESLAKGVRFDMPVEKFYTLNNIRGSKKWKLGGIQDSVLACRCGKCELGHALRYEFYAVPEDEEINFVGIGRGGDIYEEMKSHGAIVFGETCSSDFFHITKEGMDALRKVRDDMKKEIEYLANTMANIKSEADLKEEMKKLAMIYEYMSKLGGPEKLEYVFGKKLSVHIINFIVAGLPFPKSMVLMMSLAVNTYKERALYAIMPDKEDTIKEILNTTDYNSKPDVLAYTKWFIDYALKYSFEGMYRYDPLDDTIDKRRDVGRYNAETRQERARINRSIKNICSTNISKISFGTIKDMIELCEEVKKTVARYENILGTSNNLERAIEEYRFMKDEDTWSKDVAKQVYAMLTCLKMNKGRYSRDLSYGIEGNNIYSGLYSSIEGDNGFVRRMTPREVVDSIRYAESNNYADIDSATKIWEVRKDTNEDLKKDFYIKVTMKGEANYLTMLNMTIIKTTGEYVRDITGRKAICLTEDVFGGTIDTNSAEKFEETTKDEFESLRRMAELKIKNVIHPIAKLYLKYGSDISDTNRERVTELCTVSKPWEEMPATKASFRLAIKALRKFIEKYLPDGKDINILTMTQNDYSLIERAIKDEIKADEDSKRNEDNKESKDTVAENSSNKETLRGDNPILVTFIYAHMELMSRSDYDTVRSILSNVATKDMTYRQAAKVNSVLGVVNATLRNDHDMICAYSGKDVTSDVKKNILERANRKAEELKGKPLSNRTKFDLTILESVNKYNNVSDKQLWYLAELIDADELYRLK